MSSKTSFYSSLLVMSISYLSLGLVLPAMSLIIVSKGFSLPYLGIAMLSMSISVMVFEVPSGIFCDAKGRRMSFQLGMFITLVGTSLLFSSSFLLLCIGFSLNGIGRAFTSGSLDALLIEEHQDSKRTLEDIVFALEVTSSISLAIGALVGGYLLTLGTTGVHLTDKVLLGRIVLIGTNLILIPLLISKDSITKGSRKISEQISLLFQGLKQQPRILAYIITVIMQGIFLSSIETYWQPYLKRILQDDSKLWILGVVVSLMFAMSIIGTFIGKRLLGNISAKKLYIGFFLGDFLLIGLLATTSNLFMFLFLFLAIYVVLGGLSIASGTLLNQSLDNSLRSSVLSLSSFSLQAGGAFSSFISVILLSYVDISGFWIIVGMFGALVILAFSRRI